MTTLHKLGITILAGAIISSCSSDKTSGKISYDNSFGYFKVGQPYEIEGQVYHPRVQPDYEETGIASWYGDDFNGKETANGDVFDKNALTAAHKTLPLPSMVRVTNLENNKTLIVMVNDRGPFSRGRVIDLSERAADILGFRDRGIAKVKVQFLKGHTQRLLAKLPGADKSLVNDTSKSLITQSVKQAVSSALPNSMPSPIKQATNRAIGQAVSNSYNTASNTISNNNYDNKNSDEPIDTFNYSKVETVDEFPKIIIKSNAEATKISPSAEIASEYSNNVSNEYEYKNKYSASNSNANFNANDNYTSNNNSETKNFYIQAGTFSLKENADRLESSLSHLGSVQTTPVMLNNTKMYRVRLGPINNKENAELSLKRIVNLGHADAMVVGDYQER